MQSRFRRSRAAHFILVFLILVGLAYWRYGLFPGNLKDGPKKYLNELTHLDIDFDRVHYLPFWGIHLDGVEIQAEGGPLLTARSLHIKTKLFSLLTEKKIIFPRVTLNGVETTFRMNLEKSGPTEPAKEDSQDPESPEPLLFVGALIQRSFLPSNMYLEEVSIQNSRIEFQSANKSAKEPMEALSGMELNIDWVDTVRIYRTPL